MTQEVSMAAEEENLDLEDETPDARKGKKAAKHDSKGAADLDKVTDYVEEVEISNQNMGDVSISFWFCVLSHIIAQLSHSQCLHDS